MSNQSELILLTDGSRLTWKMHTAPDVKDSGPGRLTFLVSTNEMDTDGDIIHPMPTDKGRGWVVDHFNKSPLMLWQHDRKIPNLAKRGTTAVPFASGLLLDPAVFDIDDPAAAFIEGKIRRESICEFSVGLHFLKSDPIAGARFESHETDLVEVSPVKRGANTSTAVLAKAALLFRPDLAEQLEDAGDPETIELKAELEELRGRLVTAENLIAKIGADVAGRVIEQKNDALSAHDEAVMHVLNRMKVIGTAS